MQAPEGLDRWCRDHLGAGIDERLWSTGHLSAVVAVRLDDGREVVLKARPPAPSLAGCDAVHRHVWAAGFPCAEPLVSPSALAGLVVSAEALLPGGRPGHGDDPTLAERTAVELHRLVVVAPRVQDVPTLDPPRPWAGWSDPGADPWPPPDEGAPLNDLAVVEPVRALAVALNERLLSADLARVVGHVDWYQGNLRWDDARLVAVDDWDSVVALPEAAIVGCAGASFRPGVDGRHPDGWPGAEVDDTHAFLEHYQHAAARSFTSHEVEVAWAAGLWQRVFDAAKALAAGNPASAADQLRDADARRRLAGL